jgi:hypothetical protein
MKVICWRSRESRLAAGWLSITTESVRLSTSGRQLDAHSGDGRPVSRRLYNGNRRMETHSLAFPYVIA